VAEGGELEGGGLVVWPLVCEGVEAGGEGDRGDWVHGCDFPGLWS
jgi:hypothetical protein